MFSDDLFRRNVPVFACRDWVEPAETARTSSNPETIRSVPFDYKFSASMLNPPLRYYGPHSKHRTPPFDIY